MKTKLLTICCLVLFFASCTEDGKDGNAYLSIDWEYVDSEFKVSSYSDNNPAIPSSIERGKYYGTDPGTYSYSYQSEDYQYYYTHSGTYTIYINYGTDATFFENGIDGEDEYFDLYLSVYKRKGEDKGDGQNSVESRNDTFYFKNGCIVINEKITISYKINK
jgi:hypothetical protein